jgi:hypothetical protein
MEQTLTSNSLAGNNVRRFTVQELTEIGRRARSRGAKYRPKKDFYRVESAQGYVHVYVGNWWLPAAVRIVLSKFLLSPASWDRPKFAKWHPTAFQMLMDELEPGGTLEIVGAEVLGAATGSTQRALDSKTWHRR